jgi:hypothetical protein
VASSFAAALPPGGHVPPISTKGERLMLIPIILEAIEHGEVLTEVNKELELISADVANRPYCDAARTVTLKITLKPGKPQGNVKSGQVLFLPELSWSVGKTSPGAKGAVTRGIVKDGQVLISPNASPDDAPGQLNIFDVNNEQEQHAQ